MVKHILKHSLTHLRKKDSQALSLIKKQTLNRHLWVRIARTFVFAGLVGAFWVNRLIAEDIKIEGNPIIRDRFTADPAPVVIGDTVYLIVDHDEARGSEMFTMKDWLCFTSKDMENWAPHDPIMKVSDFKWAEKDAWAPQMVPRNGKFYFYAPANHDRTHPGFAIGVTVADNPLGPYTDARGTALITPEMTKGPYYGPNIDPSPAARGFASALHDPLALASTLARPFRPWRKGTCAF